MLSDDDARRLESQDRAWIEEMVWKKVVLVRLLLAAIPVRDLSIGTIECAAINS